MKGILMAANTIDVISIEAAHTLHGLFLERVQRTPESEAYRYYDTDLSRWVSISWREMAQHVARWKAALKAESLQTGDRVGIMLRNCPQWVMFEQAALSLGLVVVPLYTNDRAENIGYILSDAEVRVLLIDTQAQWDELKSARDQLNSLHRIVTASTVVDDTESRLIRYSDWVSEQAPPLSRPVFPPETLASIVYTSGTTGRPKGVMLSHRNIVWNANSASRCESFYTSDIYLSFLPLSHMFERTVGYYLPMMTGGSVVYARSIELLGEDFLVVRPTLLITVPRIFERVYNKVQAQLATKSRLARTLFMFTVRVGWQRFQHQQQRIGWRPILVLWPLLNVLVAKKIITKLGGRLRLSISGGAPLSYAIAQIFIGLGVTISQGYGMTELSPVVCTNRLRDNKPDSVGQAFPDVEVKLGDGDELLVRGPGVMLGYWKNPTATAAIIDTHGWLHTGDKAKLDGDHIYITGRLKEIIVLANGEKIPPSDVEMAISTDSLIEQSMIVGEGKPFLSALVVLNPDKWRELSKRLSLSSPDSDQLHDARVCEDILSRITRCLHAFPGYAKVFKVHCTLEPWTVDNELITPTLKLRRQKIQAKYQDIIDNFYSGH